MALVNGWTDGDVNAPFFPSGIIDWSEFYTSIGKPKDYSLPVGMDDTGLPTSKIKFEDLAGFLQNALPRGKRDVVLPNGQTVAPSGSTSLDFMRGIFGVSPLDTSAKTPKGDAVEPGTGGALEPVGALFVRTALIAIGAVVVLVSLWMLLSQKGK